MEATGSLLAQVALAVCVVIASVLFFLYQHTSASAAASSSDAKPPRAAKKAKPAPAPAKPQPPMLEVKVLYATTSGTSRRYADELRRDAFALHIAGFHLKITLVDLATYAIDAIENETLCVFLLPTMAGGVPPASATLFCANVRDMATDFRVSKVRAFRPAQQQQPPPAVTQSQSHPRFFTSRRSPAARNSASPCPRAGRAVQAIVCHLRSRVRGV